MSDMSDMSNEEATIDSPMKKNPHGRVSKNFILIILFYSENYDKVYIKML